MDIAAILTLLFFSPLSFVYARHVARSLHRESHRRSLWRRAAIRLIFPAVLLAGMVISTMGRRAFLAEMPSGAAENGGVVLVVWIIGQLGNLGLILFFLAIPYLMGSVFGAVTALAGFWRDEPPVAEAAEE